MAISEHTFARSREPLDVPFSSQFDILRSAVVRDELLSKLARLACNSQIDRALQDAAQASLDGRLSDSDYAAVSAALTAMRAVLPSRPTVAQRVPDLAAVWKEAGRSRFKEHVRKRMPTEKKAEYIERRRELAASGMMPRQLAAAFTTGQLAALAIVAQEVAKFGRCTLVIEKIAGLAGVCHATVRRGIARARELGLVAVAYREKRGAPSLSNVVTVLSVSWRDWIKRRSQGVSLKDLLRRYAAKTPPAFFFDVLNQKCNPTPSTININGNRPRADYSVSVIFDGISGSALPRNGPA